MRGSRDPWGSGKFLRAGFQVSAETACPLHLRCQANCVFFPGSQFWVTAQRTEAAERCGLHGSYVLRVEAERLTLLTVGAQSQILEPLLSWPYTLLRRYGRDKVLGWRGVCVGWGAVREGWFPGPRAVGRVGAGQEGRKFCPLYNPSLPSP